MKINRIGMTLIEIMISVLILFTLMVMVLMSMTKTLEYSILAEYDDTITIEASQIFNEITEDLSRSAWYFPVESQSDVDAATITGDPRVARVRSGDFRADTLSADREMRYYPKVLMQLSDDNKTLAMPWLQREEKFADMDYPEYTEFIPESSLYRQPSTELVFVRSSRSAWTAVPSDSQGEQRLYFPGSSDDWNPTVQDVTKDPHDWLGLTVDERVKVAAAYGKQDELAVLKMSDWDVPIVNDELATHIVRDLGTDSDPRLANVPVVNVPGAWLRWEAGEIAIMPHWETMVESPEVVVETGEIDIDQIREYQYALVPPLEGKGHNRVGRLVRIYSTMDEPEPMSPGQIYPEVGDAVAESEDGDLFMVVDKVLSDNVTRIIFETYRTNDDLGLNEVRVILYMAGVSKSKEGVQTLKRFSRTIQMRTASDPVNNREKLDAFIGETEKVALPLL